MSANDEKFSFHQPDVYFNLQTSWTKIEVENIKNNVLKCNKNM